jgi:hypothetical protein
MKTSFSMKVTGSITISIEPSNDGGGGVDANDGDDNGDNVLFDALLAPYMKSLMNDAIKKYVLTVGEEEDEELSSPLPKRRIPANADDSIEEEEEDTSVEEEEEASVEEEEDEDEASDLPNVQVEYRYADDNSLSQKMNTLNLRRRH